MLNANERRGGSRKRGKQKRPRRSRASARVVAVAAALALACAAVEPCLAASGAFVDTAATVIAVIVIVFVPVAGIALFWLVHVLPEKIAEKRQHPQKDAIHVLCLLSLVFGGLLWPLAWLWAYSKPVLYRMAYGRDKHEDFYAETASEGGDGAEPPLPEQDSAARAEEAALRDELAQLRHELDVLEKRGPLSAELDGIRARLVELEARSAPGRASGGSH